MIVRTIMIDTLKVNATDFNSMDQKKKDALYASGVSAAEQFLQTWNFEEYIKQYRMGTISGALASRRQCPEMICPPCIHGSAGTPRSSWGQSSGRCSCKVRTSCLI